MKKIVFLLIVLITTLSCSEDVKFNNPGFQAYRDGQLFRAENVSAYKSVSTGDISIVAIAQEEDVEINISNSNVGTYYFGTTDIFTNALYNSSFSSIPLSYRTNIVLGPVAKMNNFMINLYNV